jgi:hypothetical protein
MEAEANSRQSVVMTTSNCWVFRTSPSRQLLINGGRWNTSHGTTARTDCLTRWLSHEASIGGDDQPL